ncbi:uncharacterized protein [Antedon mediterranea]|uniref:uncharacterized protein n=1 Tax=Antedon mediterranea TaxID=105859 RepID=UPI003AF4F89C
MRVRYVLAVFVALFICSECMICFCGKTLKEKKKLCKGSPTKSSECPFGTNLVPDACGCCQECSKRLNEPCGSMMSAMGKCSNGLICSCRPPLNTGYCTVPQTCDSVRKDDTRGFLTPRFNSHHEKCRQKLIAPSDQVVHLMIYKASGLGYAQQGRTCVTKLQIIDYTEHSGKQITDVCSNQEGGFPIKFKSSTRRLDIVFIQDERGCGYYGPFDMNAKYRASYEFVPSEGSGTDRHNLSMIP